MIAYISGTVQEVLADHIVLDNGGIGYEIYMPSTDLERVTREMDLKVFTYFQVREDAFVLYGFLKQETLNLFRLLIGVNGVGPKAAVAILSALSPNDLRFAIAGGDAKLITRAQGIGQKTAQRIILDLKDKVSVEEMLDSTGDSNDSAGTEQSGSMNQSRKDAILALEALGYSSSEVLQAMSSFPADTEMDSESWIKEVLKKIGLKL